MIKSKRLLAAVLSCIMIFAMFAVPVSASAAAKPKLNKTKATITRTKSVKLKLKNATKIEAIGRAAAVSRANASDDGVDKVAVTSQLFGGRRQFVKVAGDPLVDEIRGATKKLGLALGANGEI